MLIFFLEPCLGTPEIIPSMLYYIEKEQYNPSLMLAYRIAQVFGTTVEDLCCLQENKALEDQQYEEE